MGNTEKKTVLGFENFVFAVTRVFALFGAVFVLIGIFVLAIILLLPGECFMVNYDDILKEISKTSVTNNDGSSPLEITSTLTVSIPDNLKEYFFEENESILTGWIAGLSEKQQQEFLDNLSLIVQSIRKDTNIASSDVESEVIKAINVFHTLKMDRFTEEEMQTYTKMATKAGYISSICGLLLILSILSLVLVMLAVERNTRVNRVSVPIPVK